MAKLRMIFDGSRDLLITDRGALGFQVRATSESDNPAMRRKSKTWHFESEGVEYRIQIQATHPNQESYEA